MKQLTAHYSSDRSGVTLDRFPVYADASPNHEGRAMAFLSLAENGLTTYAKSLAYASRLPYRDAKQALKIWNGGE
jgi:hypothetical protein